MIRVFNIVICCLSVLGLPVCAHASGLLIESFDQLQIQGPKDKATVAAVSGHQGQAAEFRFQKDAVSAFCITKIRAAASWDEAAGLSFWVRGDGSNNVGVLHFIYDDDYAVRYEFAFPLTNTDWHQVTVAWKDLTPVLPGKNSVPLDPKSGNRPSKLSGLWFGKWWHWRDYPATTFAIDDLELQPAVTHPAYQVAAGLEKVRAKLRKGEPVTIVTMGDSLTDTRHWANRQVDWGHLLKQQLEAQSRSKITLVNPAIGGTQLRHGVIQIPRWRIEAPHPDLVTICYGGNDWDAGMRGPQFLQSLLNAVEQLRQATNGQTEILILSTVPSVKNWTTMDELAASCRTASQQAQTGFADLNQAFHEAGKAEPEKLYVEDKVHLSKQGHELVAQTVKSLLAE